MRAQRFEFESTFPVPARDLWAFHMHDAALEVLAPPFSGFRVIDRGEGVADGSVLVAEVGHGPFRQVWKALHYGVRTGQAFTDVALEAPFPYWVHHHRVDEVDAGTSRLTDSVLYVPPQWLPSAVAPQVVAMALRLFFGWRHRATRRWLAEHGPSESRTERVVGDLAEGGCS